MPKEIKKSSCSAYNENDPINACQTCDGKLKILDGSGTNYRFMSYNCFRY